MRIFEYENKDTRQILALGPESNGNFSFFYQNKLYFSEDFGDLLIDKNFHNYKTGLSKFLSANNFRPDIILTDSHPLYKTTTLGRNLAKKYPARLIQIQHHLAHIFSAIGDKTLLTRNYQLEKALGITLDGTGYGSDDKIWGGEIFRISKSKFQILNQIPQLKLQIERIGHLENQVMIGGDLAIKEPARMLIGILSKFLPKESIYPHIRKYYSAQEFEVLYNQSQQKFNCIETSSTGRILDAVSVLLGFCGNQRNYKHEPIELLEKNSAKPYLDLKPEISKDSDGNHILSTTYLFNYILKYLHKNKDISDGDRNRLAATAQLYIAQGLYRIISDADFEIRDFYLAGGIANNKIISGYLDSKGAYASRTIPRGDAGLSFGQIVFYLSGH
ncbi:MAG: hypothetical protein WC120_01410 [Parcubacteria group bacterium]